MHNDPNNHVTRTGALAAVMIHTNTNTAQTLIPIPILGIGPIPIPGIGPILIPIPGIGGTRLRRFIFHIINCTRKFSLIDEFHGRRKRARNICHTREKTLGKIHLSYYERCSDILSYKRDQSRKIFLLIRKD